jgi:hypothetical protein
MYNYKMKAYFK